ncbi:MAG: hypothetical protein WAV32_02815 [Halobacteriota archaeon]
MAVISVSLTDEILNEIDRLQKELVFSGRLEVIRAGARMLLADNKNRAALEGRLNYVLLLIHAQKVEDTLTEVKHEFEDIIFHKILNFISSSLFFVKSRGF